MIQHKTEKSHDKRKAILTACLKLFNETCFQDTSTARISQEAGIATGTLFLYFENKEELVNDLYLECKNEYALYIEQGFDQHQTFKAQLKHIWDRGLEWRVNNADKMTFMMQFSTSPYITKMTKEKALGRLTLINDAVAAAIQRNEVTASSVELLAGMISGYFHTAGLFLLEHRNDKDFRKWADESFNFFWKGIN